jgi:protein-tyrosine phosphatase
MNTTAEPVRIVSLEGGINFRDLGGYLGADGRRVRWRRVFRSGSTHALSPASRQLLSALGIRAAVDLRSRQEQDEHPHALCAEGGCEYLAFDHDHSGGDLLTLLERPDIHASHLHLAMAQLYRELPYQFTEIYRELFRVLARSPLPMVFNCAAGKDRTGVAAALLLTALGVAWEDIEADYLLTQQFVAEIKNSVIGSRWGRRLTRLDPVTIAPLFGVETSYLTAMREAILVRSGSFERYFQNDLKLEPALLQELRERLLH